MASTNKTENLGLPKWESKAETLTMEDMTGAFETIDRAVAERLTFGLVKEYTIPASRKKESSVDVSDLNMGDYYMVLFYFPSLIYSNMKSSTSGHSAYLATGSTALFFPMKNPSVQSFGICAGSNAADYVNLGYAYDSVKNLTFTIPNNVDYTFNQECKMQVWGLK